MERLEYGEMDCVTTAQPSEFSRKTLKTFLLRLLTQAFTVGAGIIIARSLGPPGKGMFTYAATVLTLLVTLGGGASAAISRQYGRRRMPSSVVYAAMMRFFFLVCLPICALLAAFALLTHQFVLLAPAAAFPFSYLNQVSIAFSLADGDVNLANFQGLLVAAGTAAVAGILCFILKLNVGALLAGWVALNGAVTIYSLKNIAKYARGPIGEEDRATAFREQFTFGFRVTLNQLLTLLNYQVDIFIVLFILGHASLGRYSIAVGIGMMMWQLSRPLTVTSYGSMTRGTPREAAQVTILCIRHALFSVGAACVVLAFVGPWLLQAVYGPAFSAAGRALQLLLPGIVAYCTVPFFGQYFTLQVGKPGINTFIIALSTVTCGIITVLLIHRYGIAAGAIGTSVSYCIAFAVSAFIFCRATGTMPGELLAFKSRDLRPYVVLAQWMVSGMRSVVYARRA